MVSLSGEGVLFLDGDVSRGGPDVFLFLPDSFGSMNSSISFCFPLSFFGAIWFSLILEEQV
jgi:hypothetical protein